MGEVSDLGGLKPDPQNLRRHNARNLGMIEDALREVGAARSIVIDETDTVLAGNATVDAAAAAGITKVKVVEADGNTIIAVRRRGLTKKQKKRLAAFDNRTAELADWDVDELLEATEDLDGIFTSSEIDRLVELSEHERRKESDEDEEDDPTGDDDGGDPVDLSPQPHERYNYVVLLFRNDPDWARALEHFQVQRVQDPTSTAIGVGRVLDGAKYLKRAMGGAK